MGTRSELAPVAGLVESFSPMPRIAPPPFGAARAGSRPWADVAPPCVGRSAAPPTGRAPVVAPSFPRSTVARNDRPLPRAGSRRDVDLGLPHHGEHVVLAVDDRTAEVERIALGHRAEPYTVPPAP